MTPTTTADASMERAAFEAWYRSEWPVQSQQGALARHQTVKNGDYYPDSHTDLAWSIWQARAAISETNASTERLLEAMEHMVDNTRVGTCCRQTMDNALRVLRETATGERWDGERWIKLAAPKEAAEPTREDALRAAFIEWARDEWGENTLAFVRFKEGREFHNSTITDAWKQWQSMARALLSTPRTETAPDAVAEVVEADGELHPRWIDECRSVCTAGTKLYTRTEAAAEGFYDAYWKKKDAAAAVAPDACSDDQWVDKFAQAMKDKLAQKRGEGRGGWEHCDPAILSRMLIDHVAKGDPVDVANLSMMLWAHEEPIEPDDGTSAHAAPSNVREQVPVAYGAFDADSDRCYIAAAITESVRRWIGLDDRYHVEPLFRALKSATPDAGKVRFLEPDEFDENGKPIARKPS